MAQSLRELKLVALGDGLRTCPIFAGLTRESLLAVAGITVLKAAEPGEFLFRRREAARELNVVLVGAVRVRRETEVASESEPDLFRRGELIEDSWVSKDREYLCDAVVEERSQILQVNRAGFEKLLREHSSIALAMIRSLNQRARFSAARAGELAEHDAEVRILNWLVCQRPKARSKSGYLVEIVESKRRLAEELRIDFRALAAGMKRLCDGKWLEVEGLKVTVRDANALETLLRQKLGG